MMEEGRQDGLRRSKRSRPTDVVMKEVNVTKLEEKELRQK